MKYLFLLSGLIISTLVSAQNSRIDSLLIKLKTDKEDTNKVKDLGKLSHLYRKMHQYDSSLNCAKTQLELSAKLNFRSGKASSLTNIGSIYDDEDKYPEALKSYLEALKIDQELNDKWSIQFTLNDLGNVSADMGNYSEALNYYRQSLMLAKEIKNNHGIGVAYHNTGIIYNHRGNYPEALKNYFEGLKVRESMDDKEGIADSHNSIGTVFGAQHNYPEALKNYFMSLRIMESIDNKNGQSIALNNIGLVFMEQNKYPEALEKFKASLKLLETLKNRRGIASALDNIGIIYQEQKNYGAALENYLKGLSINEDIGYKRGITYSCVNLGVLYRLMMKNKEAQTYYERALKLSHEMGDKENMKSCYAELTRLDSAVGNFKEAYEFHKLYIVYRDSLNNEEVTRKTMQAGMQYEFDKKEIASKAEQKILDALAEADRRKQQLVIYVGAGVLTLVLLFSFFLYKRFKLTQKQKLIIENQKQQVEEHRQEIVDSITYAKRLQQAILPPVGVLRKQFPESFIYYQPKAIVAGDFYWIHTTAEAVYLAAADCTGHGVPGAMVSVVCSNALNRAVKEFNLSDTGKILDKTRELVIETFEKSDDTVNDGMDISLLRIEQNNADKSCARIQWSGANNSLWYIRNNVLNEVKADKQPIGKHDQSVSFTTHNLTLDGPVSLYLFSDGYADQFSQNEKKIMKKKFKDIVLSIHTLTMAEQKNHLEQFHLEWKGAMEQTDDILVMGVRLLVQ